MSSQDNVPVDVKASTGKGGKKSTPSGVDSPKAESTPSGVDSPKTRDLNKTEPTPKGVGSSKGNVTPSEETILKSKNTPVSTSPVESPKEEQCPPSPGRSLYADAADVH